MWITLLSLASLLLLYCWYFFCYAPYRVLKRLGITHPPVRPFMGNALQVLKLGYNDLLTKWINENGKVFGYYIGAKVHIVVADLDILKVITVKESDKFIDTDKEPDVMNQVRKNIKLGSGLVFEKDEEWKRVRRIVSPTFSIKKLKQMMPLVERNCDILNTVFDGISNTGQSVNIHKIFGQFSLQTMLAVAFGSEVNLLKGEGSLLTDAAAGFFGSLSDSFFTWENIFSSHFPILMKYASVMVAKYVPLASHMKNINDASMEILKSRREQVESGSEKLKDFIQLLMDARADESSDEESSNKENMLNDLQIAGVCFDFMVGGYETTANALACTSYLLSLNPDEQERLCEAIDNYYQENEDASLYDASQNIPYLDWVIQEALCMHPAASYRPRLCNETCTINGVTFLKGAKVMIPIQFSPEGKEGRNPLSHIPFGWGPRSCIGMRFALMEAKACLVSILRKYRFERSPDTQGRGMGVVGPALKPRGVIMIDVTMPRQGALEWRSRIPTGLIVAESSNEHTIDLTQEEIVGQARLAVATQYFNTKLNELGSYSINHSRSGCYLHNETVFAAAQKQFVYIYDRTGTELHRISKMMSVNKLGFLPYHFLLVSAVIEARTSAEEEWGLETGPKEAWKAYDDEYSTQEPSANQNEKNGLESDDFMQNGLPTQPPQDIDLLQPEREPYQPQKSMQDVDSNAAGVKVQTGSCACAEKVKKGLLQSLQSCVNVLNAEESCTGRNKRAVYEIVQLMSSCACSQKVNRDLMQSLKSCNDAMITASSCTSTFASCAEVKSYNPGSASGNYQLYINNKTIPVYCHMGALCGIDGGWTRLGMLDMTQSSSTCPSSLQLITQSNIRFCTKNKAGCQSIPIPSQGLKYSQVCGRVRGYQRYTLDGFLNRGIDQIYVDGVSITRGSPRKHVWSFGGSQANYRCPCSGSIKPPSFVGSDYYCESGFPGGHRNTFGVTDPLWDGKNCPSNEAKCCSPPLLPWFLKKIGSTITDNIEMRVCTDEAPDSHSLIVAESSNERTIDSTQEEIVGQARLAVATQYFNTKLNELGPYFINHLREVDGALEARTNAEEEWDLETGPKEAWKAYDEYGTQEPSANQKENGLKSDDFMQNGMAKQPSQDVDLLQPERDSYQPQKSMQDVDSNAAGVKIQAGSCACAEKIRKGLLQSLESCVNVIKAMESCTGRNKRAVYESVQLMSTCACAQKANRDLMQSLKSCTDAMMTTTTCLASFSSCAEIKSYNPGSASGDYQLYINNKSVTVYCHMGALCGIDGGWTRLGKLDITQPSSTCPTSLQLITQSSTRICTKNQAGCKSIPVPSQGLKYSQVCGRVRGYQRYTLEGFINHKTIDQGYVDGVSITRGSPRKHVWSLGGSTQNYGGCPCSGGRKPASFVGSDYYCESGFPGGPQNTFGVADPLWDGKNCPSNEAKCCTPPLLPWFLKKIGSTITDNIEIRVCSDEAPGNENIGIDQYEIYVN
uniref:Thromboxane-A synthase n=1 Tax=Amphimedon queenslandica TaxID=400682 RepID=A0A1X7USB7_AMPQE